MPARRDCALILALLTLASSPLAAQTATLVKDVNPLEETALGDSSPRWLHAVGDKVFFTASEASSGLEMWVTDSTELGTGLGTELLVDACPGECSWQPLPVGHAGGILFWTTRSFTDGLQLWRSDGTRAGTFLLTTGLTRRYSNIEGRFASVGDTEAF